MQKIQTKAKEFGTFVSPTTGEILYVDPDHDSEVHTAPQFTQEEADEAFRRGLIEDPKDAGRVQDVDPASTIDPNAIGTLAAERTAEFAKLDNDVSSQPSTLDSRSSTAWPDTARVEGAAEGYADGVRVAEELEADAAPAPRRGRAKAAAATPSSDT